MRAPDMPATEHRRAEQPLDRRAVVLGALLVIAFSIAGVFSVFLRMESLGLGYLPRGVVFLWLLLLGVNALLHRVSPRHALSRRGVLIVLLMLLAIGALVGEEFTMHFYLYIVSIIYFAQPPIASPDLYLRQVPASLVPSLDVNDPSIAWAFEGLPSGRHMPYGAWIGPLLIWTPFILGVYFLLTCFAGILARRWEQEEKLVYPLTQVPLELVEAGTSSEGPLWKSKLMWACFAAPCTLYAFKGLHAYFPAVPDIKTQLQSGAAFSGPWVAFNSLSLEVYLDVIAIAYLLTREAAFSVWFFYLFRLFEDFLGNVFGQTQSHYRFFTYETVGGYAVLGAALLWSARPYLRRVFRAAFTRRPDGVDPGERFCVYGFLGGLAFVVLWSSQVGMSWWWALLMLGLFPLVSLVVSRVVCEAGMFYYSSPFRLNEVIFEMAGPRTLGVRNLVLMTMTSWTQIRVTATQYMPAAFQNYRIASDAQISRRQVILLAMGAIFLAVLMSHIFSPYVFYRWSIPKLSDWVQSSGPGTTRALARYITSPTSLSASDWAGVGLGVVTTVFLVAMRQRFLWWPFHPLGFIAWIGWPTERYWLSYLIGWAIKSVVVRLFGFTVFRQLRPGAFGLILGTCFAHTFWILLHFFYPAPALLIG